MSQPQPATTVPSTQPKRLSTRTIIAIIVIIVGLVVGLGGYAGTTVYQASRQPNIQATAINTQPPITNPQTSTVVNQGVVSNSGAFVFTANLPGTYTLVFDNSFSTFSSKSVSLTLTGSTTLSFVVTAGATKQIPYSLSSGQTISGLFSVSGGSGNDIDFYVSAQTCTQTIAFSFTLVNPGSANGFATVQFLVDGRAAWNNRYLVSEGQQVQGTGSVTLPDCNSHTTNVTVSQQGKT
jgi:hypothetical protein